MTPRPTFPQYLGQLIGNLLTGLQHVWANGPPVGFWMFLLTFSIFLAIILYVAKVSNVAFGNEDSGRKLLGLTVLFFSYLLFAFLGLDYLHTYY